MRNYLPNTKWTSPDPIPECSTKDKIKLRCQCGSITFIRVSDLLDGGSKQCRSCADSANGATPEHQAKITELARKHNLERHAKRYAALGVSREEWARIRTIMQGARNRCKNPDDGNYYNYGRRGICFNFDSPSQAAEWAIKNIGVPKENETLDRIDNNGHYESGNLRWADRKTQNSNKRQYRRSPVGERIRKLQAAGSPYHYESLRGFINKGLSDEEILTKVPYERSDL